MRPGLSLSPAIQGNLVTRWRNVWDFARMVVARFLDDDCPLRAASIAYYALLSIFPFLLAVAAILANLLEEARVWAVIQDALRTYLPPRARAIVLENIEEAIRLRGPVGTASAIAFLWSAAAVVGAIRHSLNRVWDVKRARPFWRRKVLEVAATLALGVILGSLIAVSVGLSLLSELGWKAPYVEPSGGSLLIDVLRESGNILIVFAALILIYKVLPNRPLRWQWLWPGALAAALVLEGGRHAAFWGLARFAQYQLVYGSIAGIIVFLLWMYFVAMILLLGAEISRCRAFSP